jgi:hypothetical protein
MSGPNTRKLINERVLRDCLYLADLGVPIAKIARDNMLDISLPHLNKLITWYKNAEEAQVNAHFIKASLFPKWLDNDNDNAQSQPDEYRYIGPFPYGEWKLNNKCQASSATKKVNA